MNDMRRKAVFGSLVLSASLSLSCFSPFTHVSQNLPCRGRRALPDESVEYYAPGVVPLFSETALEKRVNGDLFSKEVRCFGGDYKVVFEYYRSKIFEKPPLVLVSPILKGDYSEDSLLEVSRPVCKLLAENGISAVLVHRPDDFYNAERFPTLEHLLSSIVRERRQVLEVLVNSGQVDEARMGSFGVSMGAITNVPLAAAEPRLKYNIFGLAGGDVPSILQESSESSVQRMLVGIVEKVGEEGLKKYLHEGYRSDPLEMAQYIDPKGVRMFIARFDTVVPFKYGLLLRERMGGPETDVLPTGHYTAILCYFWIKGLIVDFFQEKFGIEKDVVEKRKQMLLIDQ